METGYAVGCGGGKGAAVAGGKIKGDGVRSWSATSAAGPVYYFANVSRPSRKEYACANTRRRHVRGKGQVRLTSGWILFHFPGGNSRFNRALR